MTGTLLAESRLQPLCVVLEDLHWADAETRAVLDSLVEQYPDLKPHLFNEGKLRSFVNVFLGEEDTRFLDGPQTPITDDSKLLIIPSIAGG